MIGRQLRVVHINPEERECIIVFMRIIGILSKLFSRGSYLAITARLRS